VKRFIVEKYRKLTLVWMIAETRPKKNLILKSSIYEKTVCRIWPVEYFFCHLKRQTILKELFKNSFDYDMNYACLLFIQ